MRSVAIVVLLFVAPAHAVPKHIAQTIDLASNDSPEGLASTTMDTPAPQVLLPTSNGATFPEDRAALRQLSSEY